jgi:hypothetical protein
MFAAIVWACYTIPGLIIALVLWISSSPSLRTWLVLNAQSVESMRLSRQVSNPKRGNNQ